MPGMFDLCNILQLVIDRFNQGPFSEQNLVSNTHQGVLHIVFNFSDKLYTIKEKVLKQSLADISLVCTQFSSDILQKLALFQRLPIIHVSGREHEIEDFTLVIDYQVQLESEEPSHGTPSTLGKPFKCLMNQDSLVTTYTQGSGVDKTDAGTGSQQDFFDENGQWKQHFLLQFYETVIGHQTWKQMFQMFTHIFLVVMLEAAKTTGVEQDNLSSTYKCNFLGADNKQ